MSLAALVAGLILVCFVSGASAAPARSGGSAAPGGSGKAAAKEGKEKKGKGKEKATPSKPKGSQVLSPGQASAGTLAKELGSSGQVDPIVGLGIQNPVCDKVREIRDRATRLSCESTGSPTSNYPNSHYGFDIFIETGVTHPVGTASAGFAYILDGVWIGVLFVLNEILELLGLAFGLNPFGDGKTMHHVAVTLGRIYNTITDPWLSALVVAGGIWFAYKGLLRREVAAGVGGTLAAIAMLVVGLWVIHHPRESVGSLAVLSDEMALATITAPRSGTLARPTGTYAEAMSETWDRLVEVPFAGLNFSDLKWALSRPPAEAVEKADEKFCNDFGVLAVLAVLSDWDSDEAKAACAGIARKRYGKPKRVIDLYLRSSPSSDARQALWDYFDNDDRYKAKVAAQGGDGVLTRLSMLALFAVGMMGAILLLAWLAIRLFTQAAIAFVMLLVAPFALFFPLLGDSGRRAFKTWGLTLLGAIVTKVIYATFLSVILMGMSILGQLNGPGGSATGFLMSCAFAWAVFLKRAELVGWMSIGGLDRADHGMMGKLAAFTAGKRIAQAPGAAMKGVGRRGGELRRTRKAERGEATRLTARSSLHEGARALADHRYSEAKRTVSEFEGREESGKKETDKKGVGKEGDAKAGNAKAGDAKSTVLPGRRAEASGSAEAGAAVDGEKRSARQPLAERYEEAKSFVARADRNQRNSGDRWSARDLKRYEAEDQELLKKQSHDPGEHAHRAGYDRTEFEALRGPDRERAEAAIEKATKRDRQRLNVAGNVPGRVTGRPSQAKEGLRQRRDGAGPERREKLKELRRDRRAAHLPSRRNLSRGG